MTKQINKCSFCGRSEREVEMLLTGATGFICNDCVERAHEMIEEILKKNKTVNSGLGFTKEESAPPSGDQEVFRSICDRTGCGKTLFVCCGIQSL